MLHASALEAGPGTAGVPGAADQASAAVSNARTAPALAWLAERCCRSASRRCPGSVGRLATEGRASRRWPTVRRRRDSSNMTGTPTVDRGAVTPHSAPPAASSVSPLNRALPDVRVLSSSLLLLRGCPHDASREGLHGRSAGCRS